MQQKDFVYLKFHYTFIHRVVVSNNGIKVVLNDTLSYYSKKLNMQQVLET